MNTNNISRWQKLTDFTAILLLTISLIAVKTVDQPVRVAEQYMVYPSQATPSLEIEACVLDLDQNGVIGEGDLSAAVANNKDTDLRVKILDHWGENCNQP